MAATLAANDKGQVIVIPGLHNRLAAVMLRHLPDWLLIAILGRGSSKYHLQE